MKNVYHFLTRFPLTVLQVATSFEICFSPFHASKLLGLFSKVFFFSICSFILYIFTKKRALSYDNLDSTTRTRKNKSHNMSVTRLGPKLSSTKIESEFENENMHKKSFWILEWTRILFVMKELKVS